VTSVLSALTFDYAQSYIIDIPVVTFNTFISLKRENDVDYITSSFLIYTLLS
jgi:hypothetical protein